MRWRRAMGSARIPRCSRGRRCPECRGAGTRIVGPFVAWCSGVPDEALVQVGERDGLPVWGPK
jgi:hypothetical protein